MIRRYGKLFGLLAGIAVFTACGSTNAPTQQLAETETVIRQAEQVGGDEYAPLELREARRKLEHAQNAMDDEDYEKAIRLAEQARIDAELAQIKTLSGQSQRAVTELRESIRILKEEIERNRNRD